MSKDKNEKSRQLTFIPVGETGGADGVDASLAGDTIYALSSGPPPAGIAVMRVSGPGAGGALSALTARPLPDPRRAAYVHLRHPQTKVTLDRAVVLWFPSPRSMTGENLAELHLHGGRAVVAGVAAALSEMDGVRLAEPGEFTRRAFENGKMDLTRAEATADLINAETEHQRTQALRQMGGELHTLYEGWRQRLVSASANAEAALDFSDEADVATEVAGTARAQAATLADEMGIHLDDKGAGERLRGGVHVAIIGAPNAGKSSVLNALARRDAAIVSETAGTTRDVIEVHLDLAGFPVTIADTAGLRQSEDAIEREGVSRALKRASDADLKLCVFDINLWPALDPDTERLIDANALFILNKCDLRAFNETEKTKAKTRNHAPLFISAKTGDGMEALLAALSEEAAKRCAIGPTPMLTRQRHRDQLERARAALGRAADPKLADELMAEELRAAAEALGRITGLIGVEDVLDVIFRDFCIGK